MRMDIENHSLHAQPPLGTATAYTLQATTADNTRPPGSCRTSSSRNARGSTLLGHLNAQGTLWFIKFFMVYLGHPILFFLFFFGLGKKSFGPFMTFTILGFNTPRINIVLYLLITFPIYITWLYLEIIVLIRVHSTFSLEKFLECVTSNASTVLSIPGILNLLVFATTGMEGDVFGVFFAVPLLLTSLSYLVLWGDTVICSCRETEPQNHDDDHDDGGAFPSKVRAVPPLPLLY